MYSRKEVEKVLKNPMTRQLVEFVDDTRNKSKMLISHQFFHKTHNKRDREVITILLKNFYPGIEIHRVGNDSVNITF